MLTTGIGTVFFAIYIRVLQCIIMSILNIFIPIFLIASNTGIGVLYERVTGNCISVLLFLLCVTVTVLLDTEPGSAGSMCICATCLDPYPKH
jgi:hypothetical protein